MKVDVHEEVFRHYRQEDVLGMVESARLRKDLLGEATVALRFKGNGKEPPLGILLRPAYLNGEGEWIDGLVGLEEHFRQKLPDLRFVDYATGIQVPR